ncbi:MAG: ThiF family adenylyltransferase, partial [Oscillospiraceae bacterium]
MMDFTLRTQALLGADSLNFVRNLKVAVLGLGGVGAAAAEGILRVGVNSLFLADNSLVKPSNLNRQLIATLETIDMQKTHAAKLRYLKINPEA